MLKMHNASFWCTFLIVKKKNITRISIEFFKIKYKSYSLVCQCGIPWCIGVWMSMLLTETAPPCFSFTVMLSRDGRLSVTERVHTAS